MKNLGTLRAFRPSASLPGRGSSFLVLARPLTSHRTLDISDDTPQQPQAAISLSEDVVGGLITGLDQSSEARLSQNVSTHSFFFSLLCSVLSLVFPESLVCSHRLVFVRRLYTGVRRTSSPRAPCSLAGAARGLGCALTGQAPSEPARLPPPPRYL